MNILSIEGNITLDDFSHDWGNGIVRSRSRRRRLKPNMLKFPNPAYFFQNIESNNAFFESSHALDQVIPWSNPLTVIYSFIFLCWHDTSASIYLQREFYK